MNIRTPAILFACLGMLVIIPASPLAPRPAHATICGASSTFSWSPPNTAGIGVFLFIQACGFNPSPGFTSSFHNVTAWTNSTTITAVSSDYYFEGDPYPCASVTTCRHVYFEDTMTKAGVFPADPETFTPGKQLGCVITNVQSFTVQYTVTGLQHTFSNSEQVDAPQAVCV